MKKPHFRAAQEKSQVPGESNIGKGQFYGPGSIGPGHVGTGAGMGNDGQLGRKPGQSVDVVPITVGQNHPANGFVGEFLDFRQHLAGGFRTDPGIDDENLFGSDVKKAVADPAADLVKVGPNLF
jgi:hypothetical protein